MVEPTRRYTFGPLEKRGLVLGLGVTQVATLLGSVTIAALLSEAVPGPGKVLVFLVCLTAAGGSTFVVVAGEPVIHWVPIWGAWRLRRWSNPYLNDDVQEGFTCRSYSRSKQVDRRLLPGLTLSALPEEPGSGEIGIVHDNRCRSLVAVVPVRGRSFSLLDPSEQVQRLDSWRSVLGAIGRPGGGLRRVQWVERSAPQSTSHRSADVAESRTLSTVAERAWQSYSSLVESAAATQAHDVWIVVSVPGLGLARSRQSASGPAEVLRRELRLLDGHLRRADLRAGTPLGPGALRELIGATPMAFDEHWSALRLDEQWHATFWISEWPRIDVNPDFLAPLLLSESQRTVSVVMAPVAPGQAVREARSARTADLADAEIRSRAGFVPSARREREADGAVRREVELADGHAEFRFSGYVTVTARDRPALENACAEAEHAAQSSRVELRRLFGRQAEAFTWTLPLARGLS